MKNRYLLIAAFAMFVVAAGILAVFFIFERGGNQPVYAKRHWVNPDSQEVLDKSLENLKVMRTHIEQWARINKNEVKKMLDTNAEDSGAIEAVIAKIPPLPNKWTDNFPGLNFGPTYTVTFKPHIADNLGIERHDFSRIARNPDDIKGLEETRLQLRRKRKHYYKRTHDMPWYEVMNNGSVGYVLYVSGRITKKKIPLEPKLDIQAETEEEEVVPPFSFLN